MTSEEIQTIVGLLVLSVVGLGVLLVAKFVWTLVIRHMSWDCPYCTFPSLKQLYRFPEEQQARIQATANRVGNLQCSPNESFVCTHCQRVVDDAIDPGGDPSEYWVVNQANPNAPRPAEMEAYPPLPCRRCGKGVVLSAGPKDYRVCDRCSCRHEWFTDEETSHSFYLEEP